MTTAIPKASAPARKTLPKGMHCEILEFTRRTRSLAGAAVTDAIPDGSPASDPEVVYDIVISTETPYKRWYAIESLSHTKSAIDMSLAKNGLSFYLEHGGPSLDNPDPELHIGIVEDIQLDEGTKKLRGVARFSSHAIAERTEQDVNDGTRRFISVGYIPIAYRVTKAALKVDEMEERLITRWKPVEVSLVGIPADPNAGVGRSAGGTEFPVEEEGVSPAEEEGTMSQTTQPAAAGEGAGAAAATITTPAATIETRSLGGGQPVAVDRNKEIAEIVRLCEANNVSARAPEFIERNMTLADAGLAILQHRKNEPFRSTAAEALEDVPEKDLAQWSINRALRMLVDRGNGKGGFSGVEAAVHQHLEKKALEAGIARSGDGMFFPMEVLPGSRHRRALTTNVAGKGTELVFDTPGELIEILRATAVLPRLGTRVLTGLSGPITFPKQTGDVIMYWIGENPPTAVSESDIGTGAILMQQKSVMGAASISREMLMQSSFDAEGMTRESFGVGASLAVDRAGFHGPGSATQPTGIYVAPDVQSVPMGSVAPTWLKITDMIGAGADKNALLGKLGFATTALMAARLMATLKSSVAGADYIWTGTTDDGQIGGYRAIGSTQLSKTLGAGADEHGFIFANWGDAVIGMWGGLEVIADPYTLAGKKLVKFTTCQMADVILRHGESFVKATAAKLA